MFYNILFRHKLSKYTYLCPEILKHNFMKTMESKQNLRELAMLKYQAEKYRIVGNGSMCQHLNTQIRKLQAQLEQRIS